MHNPVLGDTSPRRTRRTSRTNQRSDHQPRTTVLNRDWDCNTACLSHAPTHMVHSIAGRGRCQHPPSTSKVETPPAKETTLVRPRSPKSGRGASSAPPPRLRQASAIATFRRGEAHPAGPVRAPAGKTLKAPDRRKRAARAAKRAGPPCVAGLIASHALSRAGGSPTKGTQGVH